MIPPSISTFGAAPSMVGYLYQVRLALLWAIRRSRTSDFVVSLETLDDVSFEVGGEPLAVLQAPAIAQVFMLAGVLVHRATSRGCSLAVGFSSYTDEKSTSRAT